MDEMGFEYSKADPDIWFISSMKDDSIDYYQYVLLYTNNILAIMQNPEDFIRHELGNCFWVKPNSIGPPTQYLGNKVSYATLENGRNTWSFSSYQYVQDAVKTSSILYPKRGGSYQNVENFLGIVNTDLRLTLPLMSQHQEPPTTNL